MKVKALIKASMKSNKTKFGDEYKVGDMIFINGCFTPLYKATEDSRRVESFYMVSHDIESKCPTESVIELHINTAYIKEETSKKIKESEKKKKKKEKKGKSKKHG
jgi:hypothetical protein